MSEIPFGRTADVDFMFTKLVVADIDKSAAFYAGVFGLVEMHRIEAEIMKRSVSEVVFMATYAGGPMLILARFNDAPAPAHNELILGFATQDLEAALDRVVNAGGRIVEPIQQPYPGMRHAIIADGEGHLVQISQMMS